MNFNKEFSNLPAKPLFSGTFLGNDNNNIVIMDNRLEDDTYYSVLVDFSIPLIFGSLITGLIYQEFNIAANE